LDLDISSVTIWGKVFPRVGALGSSYCHGKGVQALGWSLGASRCGHKVGTPNGSVDSRHEWRDDVRMAADDGVGSALDRGSLSQQMDREWPIGLRRAAHGEKQGGLRKENGRRRASPAPENRPKGTTWP
jgi:hypothetical protein